ncbi:hypothetical protein ABT56_08955 [Photobacterium aquae]|uniref:MSHA biogenesis protein MshO n=1 Tax=Photobacterium aquae TaxID=1195763 RepID=A0A0J1H301_9GAMM|nr:type II secretion system protein [Photobacterium aquae]KLV06165.1 hypothetical protein ABT56_08955 [Photobacterium aquae]
MARLLRRQRGFTLFEMVIALVVLGVIGLGIGAYLQLGVEGYVQTVSRDQHQLIARFALEKMSREIRHAAPNSLATRQSGQCLTFYPVRLSGFYLYEPSQQSLAVTPVLGSEADWLAIDGDSWAAVGLGSASQYDAKRDRVLGVAKTREPEVLNVQLAVPLQSRSPGKRFYTYRDKVSYCFESATHSLYRLVGDNAQPSTDTLIAQDVESVAFTASGAGMNSNGMAHIKMVLSDPQSRERYSYQHTVQVMNVL